MVQHAHQYLEGDQSAEAGLPRALRVLIVEDSEDDAYLLQRQIERRYPGSYCERVDSQEAMQRALACQDWHVVISDHTMPSFDSLAALQTLKASGKDIPFIIYSGDLPEQDGVYAMRGGAQDFVYKSAPERLLPAIERELAHRKAREDKARAERSAQRLAHFDDLTGLPNHKLFMERLRQQLAEASPAGMRTVVCYLDLDRFMRINEIFGYAAGDVLIRQVGERLAHEIGDKGLLARVGRDEFAVYMSLQPHEHETMLANRLMQCFSTPFTQGGQELYLTPSLGVAVWPDHGKDALTLVRNAESAMYEAKQNGRKTYQIYRAEISADVRRRVALEGALCHAIRHGQLHVLYQPIYDAERNLLIGSEALVRWEHPEFGSISPQEFIPIADDTGLILQIGEWVLREACLQTAAWHAQGHRHLRIAVNVSATQFHDPAVVERIEAILQESGLPPHALELEITESIAMQDAERAGEIMHRLKRLGVRLAIDDFGTGYSSLAYLKRFPLDILKIDQSFVGDVNDNEDDAAIVRAILALARSLKLTAHAEGIETREQMVFLLAEGCKRMQGYLFGKPVTAAALLNR